MKKLLILQLFVLSLCSSCSNDEINQDSNQISNQDSNQVKLIKVTELITQGGELTEFGPEGSITYQYFSNNFVSVLTASGGYTKEFTYNSENQIISEVYNNDNGASFTTNYTYQDGLITIETEDNGNYTEFVYQNNQVSQMVLYHPNNPAYNGSVSLIYDSNGNVINMIDDSTSETIESYEYDDKTNPFSLLFPMAYNKIKRIPNNNMIYSEDCNKVVTYEYNDFNLPINSVYNDCGNWTKERTYLYE